MAARSTFEVLQPFIAHLNSSTLLALGDNHAKPNARLLTQALIETGTVQVLFIEWPDHNRLNAKLEELRGVSDAYLALTSPTPDIYFPRLKMDDAHPTIIELAAIAVSQRVRVVACDLAPGEVLDRITEMRRIEGYPHPPKESVLFDDEGMSVRDEFAVREIGNALKTCPAGRLMLWGDRHFQSYLGRYLKREGPNSFSVETYADSLLIKLRAIRPETKYISFDEIEQIEL